MFIENNIIHHNFMYRFRSSYLDTQLQLGIILSVIQIWVITPFSIVLVHLMFSRNMYNSIAKDDIVYNESMCAFISQCHDKEMYNNRVDNCNNWIYLFDNPFTNSVHNNITSSFNGLSFWVSSDSATDQIIANSVTDGLTITIDYNFAWINMRICKDSAQ